MASHCSAAPGWTSALASSQSPARLTAPAGASHATTAEQEAAAAHEITIMAADHALYDEDAAATLEFLEGVIP